MIIGIEAERANNPHKTGVEHYAQQLILHLAEIDKVNQYVLYLRIEPEEWLKKLPENFTLKVMPFPLFWTQLRISWEMLVNPVDVLFIPASALPLIHPKKSVVTIHDLAWQFFPETFTWFTRNFLKFSTWFAVHFASQVIAVSEATKKDLQKRYGLAYEKVSVVHHGFQISEMVEEKAPVGLPENYVLFLSTLQPRKNLEKLIGAFRLLKNQLPERTEKLVVIGQSGWKFESILKTIEENKDIVVYLNRVSEAEKAYALRRAKVLVQPSLYEGFGMQILESFTAGVPVAVSNVSSLPEVAGDAAVYFNPNNEAEIKSAIQNVLLDKSLADRLVLKGTERLKNFSWKKCAEETLVVLTK